MKKKLRYCHDRGASQAMRLISAYDQVLQAVFDRIDGVDPKLPAKEQLRKRVQAAECEISTTRSVTYPQPLLRALGKSELVESFLRRVDLGSGYSSKLGRTSLAQEICNAYIKILAILTRCRQPQLIVDFVNARIDDSFLPLEYQERQGKDGAWSRHRKKWIGVEEMDKNDWETFRDKQSTYMVPFFTFTDDSDIYHYVFESWDILPIIPVGLDPGTQRFPRPNADQPTSINSIDGGHGVVTKIKLDLPCAAFGDYRVGNMLLPPPMKMLTITVSTQR